MAANRAEICPVCGLLPGCFSLAASSSREQVLAHVPPEASTSSRLVDGGSWQDTVQGQGNSSRERAHAGDRHPGQENPPSTAAGSAETGQGAALTDLHIYQLLMAVTSEELPEGHYRLAITGFIVSILHCHFRAFSSRGTGNTVPFHRDPAGPKIGSGTSAVRRSWMPIDVWGKGDELPQDLWGLGGLKTIVTSCATYGLSRGRLPHAGREQRQPSTSTGRKSTPERKLAQLH